MKGWPTAVTMVVKMAALTEPLLAYYLADLLDGKLEVQSVVRRVDTKVFLKAQMMAGMMVEQTEQC